MKQRIMVEGLGRSAAATSGAVALALFVAGAHGQNAAGWAALRRGLDAWSALSFDADYAVS